MAIQDSTSSPFNELLGFEITQWRENYVELNLAIQTQHLNRSGTVHGGVLATLIDAAGGLAGCYCTVEGHVRRALTLSMSCQFTGQAQTGAIKIIGRRNAGGFKVFFAQIDIFNDQDELIAQGQGTYRYRKGSETLTGSPATPED